MKQPTIDLAKFIVNITYSELPDSVIKQAKKCIKDAIGCAIAGSQTEHAKILVNFIKSLKERKESTLIGHDNKSASYWTSLANASMVHGIEFDDTSAAGILHPGAPVIPTALAVGEKFNVDGKKIITSIVAGYEVELRIGLSVAPSLRSRGFHPTATVGTFGAAATAGKIMDLDEDKMASALGLAGTQASGLGEYTSSMSKHLNPGLAAQGGVIAALIAKEGFTGPHAVLKGDRGFLKAFSDVFDISKITDKLGSKFEIMGVGFKPYASSRQVHAPIDAALSLIKQHDVKIDDIEEITIGKHWAAKATREFTEPHPKTILAAQLSIPYGVAVAILEGECLLSQFSKEKIEDSKRIELAKKIKVVEDPIIIDFFKKDPLKAAFATSLNIKTKGGNSYKMNVDQPKGEPENPMTNEEFHNKFMNLASVVFPEKHIIKIENTINRLEDLDNILELTNFLKSP